MPRRRTANDFDYTPTPVPFEVSDVVTMPIEIQQQNLDDALESFAESLADLNEALVTELRRQVRVQGEKCRRAAKSFLEVKCRLHDVLGGEESRA